MSTPNRAGMYAKRAESFPEQNDYDGAIANATEALRHDPRNIDAFLFRAEAFRLKGMYRQAIADATQVIRLDPSEPAGYLSRADSYLQLEEFLQAISDATEAIRLDPESHEAYWLRNLAYQGTEDWDQAIADSQESVRLHKLALTRQSRPPAAQTRPQPAKPRWVPGTPHPSAPNVVASKQEGVWAPAPGYAWVSDGQSDLRVQMVHHLQYICPHCFAEWHGPQSVGTSTRCGNCGKVFTVFKHLGDYTQNGVQAIAEALNPLSLFNVFRNEKCVCCQKRETKSLGSRNLPQRVIGGRWHRLWLSFYSCPGCRVTWSKGDCAES